MNQFFLSGAWNFRDLGGLQTDDGRVVNPGVLFRSSALAALDEAGQQRLREVGVTDVVDLRSANERRVVGPDRLPDGVTLHTESVHDEPDEADTPPEQMASAPHEALAKVTPEQAYAKLEEAYREFPILDGSKAALVKAINLVADGSGVLVHCAAGKDRAGWITSSILRAVGVSEADVIADYLRSNDAIEPLRTSMRAKYGDNAFLTDRLLGVDEDLIRSSWKVVDDEHGSFANYLVAIGVDDDLLTRLRARLLGD